MAQIVRDRERTENSLRSRPPESVDVIAMVMEVDLNRLGEKLIYCPFLFANSVNDKL